MILSDKMKVESSERLPHVKLTIVQFLMIVLILYEHEGCVCMLRISSNELIDMINILLIKLRCEK